MDGKTPETGEKKKSLLIFSCICAVGICVLIAYIVNILTPLDRILDYRVQVKAQEDGALEITYQYRWKVLNDSKEGPLTWVSLGIPNSRCELLGYTGAISGLKNGFYGDGLIKFELDRAYKKGEVAEFGFTIRQEDMLCRNKRDGGLPFYDFMPGWFNEIAVEHYLFVWEDGTYVMETNADRKEGGFYVWEGGLKEGERRHMKVYCDKETFRDANMVEWAPVSDSPGEKKSLDPAAIIFILLCTGYIGYQAAWGKDWYANGRGFWGRGRRPGGHGGHGGCACACAGCACACACAGGGRAGCSKKDFYYTAEEPSLTEGGTHFLRQNMEGLK